MKKIIGFITIVMVLIGLIACDTEQAGSIKGGVPANTSNNTSNQSGDSSSSSASDSSSSDDSSASSQSGDDSSSSASDNSSSSDDSSSSSQETITAQYTITVVTPTYQDVDNLLSYSDDTFTAMSDYQTYSW